MRARAAAVIRGRRKGQGPTYALPIFTKPPKHKQIYQMSTSVQPIIRYKQTNKNTTLTTTTILFVPRKQK